MKINDLAAGRRLRDAIPDGDDFRLRFLDGLEIVCAWGSQGPEVKRYAFNVISDETDLHPRFRYVTGKTIKQVLTDGQKLLLEFTDGHTLRSSFRAKPAVDAVDVKVVLPGVSMSGDAGQIGHYMAIP